MGGQGSGNWIRLNKKLLTASQYYIDIRWLKQQCNLLSGASGSLFWTLRGKKIGMISFRINEDKMLISYQYKSESYGDWESIEQVISFDKTHCNYGRYM